MRDAAITEIAMREVSTYCGFGGTAYASIDPSDGQDPGRTYLFAHALLFNCALVARLLWSQEFATHAGGKTLAELLDLPNDYRIVESAVRGVVEAYDTRLAHGLALRGEVGKVLDFNIGDRDAFEEQYGLFLRHYDPSVACLTLLEEEFDLARIADELAGIKSRADAWLRDNAVLEERTATASIPPAP